MCVETWKTIFHPTSVVSNVVGSKYFIKILLEIRSQLVMPCKINISFIKKL